MPRLPLSEKPRKLTRKDLAEAARAQAELAPPRHGPVYEERIVHIARSNHEWLQYDPEFLQIEGVYYSEKELAEAVKAQKKKKRRQGRPDTFDRIKILDAAARAKAAGRPYTALAASFHLEPKQLTNLVERNRRYFDRKVRELRATTRNSAIKE